MSADILVKQLIKSASSASPYINSDSSKPQTDPELSLLAVEEEDFLNDLFEDGFIEKASKKLEDAITGEIVSLILFVNL